MEEEKKQREQEVRMQKYQKLIGCIDMEKLNKTEYNFITYDVKDAIEDGNKLDELENRLLQSILHWKHK